MILLIDVIRTKVCSPEMDRKSCNSATNEVKIQYRAKMFTHIGRHSSLGGKVWTKKGRKLDEETLFRAHKNPPATIETTMIHYKDYSIEGAYVGKHIYWGLPPKKSDFIKFTFTSPVQLESIRFVSGNAEYPFDRFVETTVEIKIAISEVAKTQRLGRLGYQRSIEDYFVVATFDREGVAMNSNITNEFGKALAVKIEVHNEKSKHWVILSEIEIITKK